MSQVFLFAIAVIIGGAIAFLWIKYKTGENIMAQIMWERTAKKELNKKKIMDLIAKKSAVANDDVENLIGVSDRTAQRYFDELEKEGKIRQSKNTGRGVFYSKK